LTYSWDAAKPVVAISPELIVAYPETAEERMSDGILNN
jgi:hypothetical protein